MWFEVGNIGLTMVERRNMGKVLCLVKIPGYKGTYSLPSFPDFVSKLPHGYFSFLVDQVALFRSSRW